MEVRGAGSEGFCNDGEGRWGNDEEAEEDANEHRPGFW